jgi:D-glycerate 3-kinase
VGSNPTLSASFCWGVSVSIDPQILQLVSNWTKLHGVGSRPPLLGITGAQGSGKSSLAQALAAELGGVALSLDDVYLTTEERRVLATAVHPLFGIRGVPGTHDLGLLTSTIEALAQAGDGASIPLPCFDKLADNRVPVTQWNLYVGKPKVIIVEGWCLGATPMTTDELHTPINALERDHDPDAVWRIAWNAALAGAYANFVAKIGAILHVKAPSFDIVHAWRCEQEEGLLSLSPGTLPPTRREELRHFIAHFERLTRHMLAGGVLARAQAKLDENRAVTSLETCLNLP